MADTNKFNLPWTREDETRSPFRIRIRDCEGMEIFCFDRHCRSSRDGSIEEVMSGVNWREDREEVRALNTLQSERVDLVLKAVNAMPDALGALKRAEQLYLDGILNTPSEEIQRVHDLRRTAIARAEGRENA